LAVSVFFGADEGAKGGVKIKSIRFQNSVSGSGLVVFLTFFFVWWVWYFYFSYHTFLSSLCRLQNLGRV
jgi:hypothetical protein